MHVIVAGAGEVGAHAAEVLSSKGYGVTVIDTDADRLRALGDALDVHTLHGHCAHLDILQAAGAKSADLLVAATNVDEINLLAAVLAKSIGIKKTIVRVHHTANFSLKGTTHATSFGVDDLLCPEYLTSLAIARAIRNPGSIALEEFSRGQLLMQRFIVTPGAAAVGKKLLDQQIPTSVRVATVETSKGISLADARTLVSEGDFVTVIGETKTFDDARKVFNQEKERRLHVAVMGQNSTAVWICRALKSRTLSVRLFVDDHARAERLAEKLDHCTVLKADPTEAGTSNEERIHDADVFIGATEDDEHNVLACAQAKALGTTTAIAVVQRKKYLHLFSHVGIDYAFSPRDVAVKAILSLIDIGPVRSVAKFAGGVAEVYEIHPSKRAKVLGYELRNIKLPKKTLIAAIRRDGKAYVPGADDQVTAGDILLAIGPSGIAGELQNLFVAK